MLENFDGKNKMPLCRLANKKHSFQRCPVTRSLTLLNRNISVKFHLSVFFKAKESIQKCFVMPAFYIKLLAGSKDFLSVRIKGITDVDGDRQHSVFIKSCLLKEQIQTSDNLP